MKSCALLTSNVLLLKFLIWIVSGILGRLCGIMCHSAFIANVSTIQPNDSLCMYLLKKVNFKLNKQARVRLISVFNSVRILHNFSLIFCFFFYFLLISFDIFKHLTYESSHSFAGIQLVLFAGWLADSLWGCCCSSLASLCSIIISTFHVYAYVMNNFLHSTST